MNDKLTARQAEVASLILRGLRHKEIAAQLWISLDTVKSHVRAIRATHGFDRADINTREALLEMEVRRLLLENEVLRRDHR